MPKFTINDERKHAKDWHRRPKMKFCTCCGQLDANEECCQYSSFEVEEGDFVPTDIYDAARHICIVYGIRGVCDLEYIANVIAMKTGHGDGKSHFWDKCEETK